MAAAAEATGSRRRETKGTRFRRLVETTDPQLLRAGAVLRWADQRERRSILRHGQVVAELLDEVDASEAAAIAAQLGDLRPITTLKELEASFEHFLGDRKRQTHGSVYTPDYVVGYLCDQALELQRAAAPVVCDPFCGSGGFLIGAAEALQRRHGIGANDAIAHHLVGIDTDEEALTQARIVLELFALANKPSRAPAAPSVFRADTFLTDRAELLALTGHPGGYDVVVTNPPYVKVQNLDVGVREALIAKYPKYTSGSFSLALLFLVAGRTLLSERGCLAAITQNNFFTSLAGAGVRAHLQDSGSLRRIIDFGHQKVFPNASAYTCLIFLGQEPSDEFEYDAVHHGVVGAARLAACEFGRVRTAELQPKKWRLAKPPHLENLRKLEARGRPLAELARIRVGFATLKDAVFLVESRGDTCLGFGAGPGGMPVEIGITRPAIKIANMRSEADVEANALRVICPYAAGAQGRQELLGEDVLATRYPSAYDYLRACRPQLEQRDKGCQDQYGAWYAWGRTQGLSASGPKLLTKTFNRGPMFLRDGSDSLFCNGYSVTPTPGMLFSESATLEWLSVVLNSDVMHYYAKLTSFQIDGGYECYQKNFIEPFCIPDTTDAERDRIQRATGDERRALLCDLFEIRLPDLEEIVSAS